MFLFRWLKRFLKPKHNLIKDKALNNLFKPWWETTNSENIKNDIKEYFDTEEVDNKEIIDLNLQPDTLSEKELELAICPTINKINCESYFSPTGIKLLKEVYKPL